MKKYDVTEYNIDAGNGVTEPMVIALLADLHDKPDDEIIESLEEKSPDVICIAGDLINGYIRYRRYRDDSYERTIEFLIRCKQIADTYLSLGNHEHVLAQAQLEEIKSTGIEVLDNRYIKIKQGVFLGGLTSAGHSHQMPEYHWLNEFQKKKGFKILMSHRPEYFALTEPFLSKRPIDLVLSGHAHGGQIRIGEQGLFAPGQGLLPKYTAGVHKGEFGCMVVSRGLANTTSIPRINNRPEIVYVIVG